ncbi:hypothetical protein CHO01_22960 [Cellulomonas hominis]|uniref:Uncharacterized protein n=1 Tax=Cellulomonas hominis TaxID=156981 RepID=A0A511FD56_9CELL|nr:hypothetical protein [Cellulomonas hominis]MBB5474625.1 hypothetical protein [Cellulomonas hominis]NKY06264.1 hypothetical protein [Cellulomonas hominis]GEL47180.1 hypothetical protein CHO01_22960 [Cellulomonas hominis]
MTSLADRSRVPAGVRTGGQFATEARGESVATLTGPADRVTELQRAIDKLARERHDWQCQMANAGALGGNELFLTCQGELELLAEQMSEAETELAHLGGAPAAAPVPVPTTSESIDKLAALLEDTYAHPEVARDQAARMVEDAVRVAGRDVDPDWVAAVIVVHRAGRLVTSDLGTWTLTSPETGQVLRDAYAAGMPVNWTEQMAQRGEGWTDRCVKRYADGLTGDELARLDAAGLAKSPAMAYAFRGCDADTARAWLDAAKADPDFNSYLARYLQLDGVGNDIRAGVPLADVRLCHELGVEPGLAYNGLQRPDGTVEKGPDAIRELAEYAKACGQSTDEAYRGIRLGIDAAKVKAFGLKIDPGEISGFELNGVPAKVARSLRGRVGDIHPAEAGRAYAAGITTGADYKAWLKIGEQTTGGHMGHRRETTTDAAGALALAKAGVPLAAAQRLRDQRVPLESIAALHEAGVHDIKPWSAALHPRTQTTMPHERRVEEAMSQIARFARVGGTPEQLRRIQRAGIPLSNAAEHVDSTPEQLWAHGAGYRNGVIKEEQRLRDQWGAMAPRATGTWDVEGPADL